MPCFYCGVRLKKAGPAMKTKDHVVPKSQGGTTTVEACLNCNQRKKNHSLEAFRSLCGGIEFWGEMRARLANTETSWLTADVFVPPTQKRTLIPSLLPRPTYTATFDLSKITQYTRGAKTKRERRKGNKVGLASQPPALEGTRFGAFVVRRRIAGKWEVVCICGALDYRSSKAVLNPKNTFDACVECRKPVGKLRSDIFKETGVEVSWEDCFQHIYSPYLEKVIED